LVIVFLVIVSFQTRRGHLTTAAQKEQRGQRLKALAIVLAGRIPFQTDTTIPIILLSSCFGGLALKFRASYGDCHVTSRS
jgi:hypothetical protein